MLIIGVHHRADGRKQSVESANVVADRTSSLMAVGGRPFVNNSCADAWETRKPDGDLEYVEDWGSLGDTELESKSAVSDRANIAFWDISLIKAGAV